MQGGAKELVLSWEATNARYSGWAACAALPCFGRLISYFANTNLASYSNVNLSIFLFTLCGFVFHNEIAYTWLNNSINVMGTKSVGAYLWKSPLQNDHSRNLVLLLLACAIFAPAGGEMTGFLLCAASVLEIILLSANLGARAWRKLNFNSVDGDRYWPVGSLTGLCAAISLGITFPYLGMTSTSASSDDIAGRPSRERRMVALGALGSALVFLISGLDPVTSALGIPRHSVGTVNTTFGIWWLLSTLSSIGICKRIHCGESRQEELILERDETSPVGWSVPILPRLSLDPSERRGKIAEDQITKTSRAVDVLGALAVVGLGAYFIWRGTDLAKNEGPSDWRFTDRSSALIDWPTPLPTETPTMLPSSSSMPSISPTLQPSVEPSRSLENSSRQSIQPSARPSLTVSSSRTMSLPPSAVRSSFPTTESDNFFIEGRIFDIELNSMTTYLDVDGVTHLNNVVDNIMTSFLQLPEPGYTDIEFSTNVLLQELDGVSLKVRLSRSALVTVRTHGLEDEIDFDSLVPKPGIFDLAILSIFNSPTMRNVLIQELRDESPDPFEHLTDINFINFYVPPTAAPSQLPTAFPSVSPSDDPSESHSAGPSQMPIMDHSQSPSSAPSLAPTISSAPTREPFVEIIDGTPFEVSFTFMTSKLDGASTESLNRGFNKIISSTLSGNGQIKVDFSTFVGFQELSAPTLTIRVVRTAFATVPRNEKGDYDLSNAPTHEELDESTRLVFSDSSLRSSLMESLRNESFVFGYLVKVDFKGFVQSATLPPSPLPSVVASAVPSALPTISASSGPSYEPSLKSSDMPSEMQSSSPSLVASMVPSASPSALPTISASSGPSYEPSLKSSDMPSEIQSSSPSLVASVVPSASPSALPTISASSEPSFDPSSESSVAPSLKTTSFLPSSHPSGEGPLSLLWATTESGQEQDGGWIISEDGFTLQFNVEASHDCNEGTNSNEQKGTAVARFTLGRYMELRVILSGMGESLDSDYESMKLAIDDSVVAQSTSNGLGKECTPSPVMATYYSSFPYILNPGEHTLVVEYTSFDGFDHYGTYYVAELGLAPYNPTLN